ncbi:MAG: sigma-70 family RNA polymerase sigma factor [Ruminococcaceae bacterium]|nr:sigma-70 family RNA polymerase sigma factor [Oscillospiraceae bacterium]
MTGEPVSMRIISSDSIDLRRWRTEHGESNREQLQRLLEHLPRAMEQELTERQRQVVEMYFYRNMSEVQIARELQVNPSTVCRTLQRATNRLRRVLLYAV